MTVSYFIPLFARLCPGVASKGANAKTRILHTLIPTLSSVLPPSPAPLSCNVAVQNQGSVYLFHAVRVSGVKAELTLAV